MSRTKTTTFRRLARCVAGCAALVSSAHAEPDASPPPVAPAIVRAIAPTGKLRASINLGNPILATRDAATGDPVGRSGGPVGGPVVGQVVGVSVDLAMELASRLGVDVELAVFDAAGQAVAAVAADRLDVGFFAIDPVRASKIAFTDPYVLIEGSYLVRTDSPIRSNDDVDATGRRVVVGKGSAYDLYLTRALRNAELIRAPTSPAVTDTFVAENADVAAGVRQQLEADARRMSGLRVLDGRFMIIEQAMGLPTSRGKEAWEFLDLFVEEMKATGFVARSLERHRIDGARVAAPGRAQ